MTLTMIRLQYSMRMIINILEISILENTYNNVVIKLYSALELILVIFHNLLIRQKIIYIYSL